MQADYLQLLKKSGFSFYWNDADKHWWLTRTGKNGKPTRSAPVSAENREQAEEAAVRWYLNKRSNV